METLKTEHADAELVPIYRHDGWAGTPRTSTTPAEGGGVYTQTINKGKSGPRLDCTDVSIRGDPLLPLTFG